MKKFKSYKEATNSSYARRGKRKRKKGGRRLLLGILVGFIISTSALLFLIGIDYFFDRYSFQSPVRIKFYPIIIKREPIVKIAPAPQKRLKSEPKQITPTLVPTKKVTKTEPFKKYLTEQGAKNREWVLSYVSKFYSGNELTAFDNLLKKEAGYRPDALNEIGAGGIGQAYPASKMGCPLTQEGLECQTIWVVGYIDSRYSGSPLIAWNFHLANNWY